LLQAFLGRARAVRVQVRQDPLTQQPDRARVDGAGMLQQRRLDLDGMRSAVGNRDRLDGVGDRRRMRSTDRTIGESHGNVWVNRFQGFTGQRPSAAEPFHRLRPTTRLHPSAPHLCSDQIRQPSQAELAGNVAGVQLGQHLQLPELNTGQLHLQRTQLSQQLPIRGGRQLFDHVFDSTVRASKGPSSTSRKPI
jgi:hypothetical protein